MNDVAPIPETAGATVALADGARGLVLADLHLGIEAAIAWEVGLEIPSRADERLTRIEGLIDRTDPDRVILLGDVIHSIGTPSGPERDEFEALIAAIDRPITLVKGNHDGDIQELVGEHQSSSGRESGIAITGTAGIRIGEVGFVHGHAWPSQSVLAAGTLVMGHEHPCVRLVDEVGGDRIERVWLRGRAEVTAFDRHECEGDRCSGSLEEIVVMPAFNELVGGTWVNDPDHEFLSPFLPAALPDGEAYLLDGTRLGPYRSI